MYAFLRGGKVQPGKRFTGTRVGCRLRRWATAEKGNGNQATCILPRLYPASRSRPPSQNQSLSPLQPANLNREKSKSPLLTLQFQSFTACINLLSIHYQLPLSDPSHSTSIKKRKMPSQPSPLSEFLASMQRK